MLIKLIGGAVIILCAAKIGFDEAGKYGKRVRELRELQVALVALKGEISFCRTPLAEALTKTARRLKTPAGEVFLAAGGGLKDGAATVKEAWDGAISAARKNLSLNGDDLDILSAFGGLLGMSDAAGQLENIELTSAKLSAREAEAEREEQRFAKLYRSLGVIGGIFLAVLFL
ncbi:MAG: stage III sporulation protein AB [Clostridiales bacterium]|jgi:stage III sporulation protein AB|nr:stage III sporulation protein AB [Clostridiales bacterium]